MELRSLTMTSLASLAAILALVAGDITEAGVCNEFRHNCNDEAARMYEVTCGKGGACTCEGSVEDSDVDTEDCAKEANDAIAADTFDTMDSDRCKALCEASTTPCKYFRWELHRKDKSCSLMTTDQCTAESPEICKDPAHCFSDGVDCGSGPIPPDPPEGENCKMNLGAHSTDSLMWYCYNVKTPDINVPVYDTPDTEVEVPPETVCETVHPCSAYEPENKLVYVCGVSGASGVDGEWAIAEGSFDADAEILKEDRTLIGVEASCPLTPLAGISKAAMDLPGADLVCTGEDLVQDEGAPDSYQLPGPNTCILMCDLNHVLTVYSDWTSTGKSWLLTFEEDPAGTDPIPATGEEIYCWP